MELKAGYVVELNDNKLYMVTYGKSKFNKKEEELCISGENKWFPARELNKDLDYVDANIRVIKVYGYATNSRAWKIETTDRELLWECAKMEMTLKEIEVLLGHPIKIVE